MESGPDPVFPARDADRHRDRRSAPLLALPDHESGPERDAGLRDGRQVPERPHLPDREGARAARSRRAERVHRHQRPGRWQSPWVAAGTSAAWGRRRGAPTVGSPVRHGAERAQRRAHEPPRSRDQGAHRALVQERRRRWIQALSIVPDSLYAKIGIQNGDVIRRINGYEMNSPDKALEIYQKLRDASRIESELERRGESLRKSYSIE